MENIGKQSAQAWAEVETPSPDDAATMAVSVPSSAPSRPQSSPAEAVAETPLQPEVPAAAQPLAEETVAARVPEPATSAANATAPDGVAACDRPVGSWPPQQDAASADHDAQTYLDLDLPDPAQPAALNASHNGAAGLRFSPVSPIAPISPMLPMPPYPGAAPIPQTPPQMPAHVPWEAASSWGATTLTISANTAAGASYLFWWVSGMLIYFNERHNRFVRFHAMQSILLTGAMTVFSVLAYIFSALCGDLYQATGLHAYQTLGTGIAALAVVFVVIPWLWAMIAAWSGNYTRLPIVGTYAERYAAPPLQPPTVF